MSSLKLTNTSKLFAVLIILTVGMLTYYCQIVVYEKSPTPLIKASPRVFIFTSDHRSIRYYGNEFYSFSALINFIYAGRYGYTYRYFQIIYNSSRILAKDTPVNAACFNRALNQERSAHWAKLQVIWYVLETYSSSYDLFLYIDSDAVINDHFISITSFLSNVSFVTASKCKVFKVDGCHIIFGYDPWQRTDSFVVPNSGLFIFRPTEQVRQWVQLWWHLNMHESNFYGFYEQDSLWNLLENIPSPGAPRPTPAELAARQAWNTKVKDIIHAHNLTQHLGIFDVETFGNRNASQFFVHMTSYFGTNHRQPELSKIWQRISKSLNESQVKSELLERGIIQFDTSNDRIPWILPISSDDHLSNSNNISV